jgi:hypothetical protein
MMKNKQGTGFRLRGCHLAVAAALAFSSPAHALKWDMGNWQGSWDNTVTYGISWRMEEQDPALYGVGNGGTGPAILTDDGNLNFNDGDIFSNIIKGTSDLEIDNGQFGFFGRIKYWYDFELENGKMPHGHSPNDYVPGEKLNDSDFADYAQFSGIELLDLFVYGSFDLGEMPLDLRIGRQVVNWGEATFIQGVNILNPIDVNAIRRPGVEIKEALLPVSLLYGNLGFGTGWSLEAFYQFKWEQTVIDGCGTYFSSADFAAQGCNELIPVAAAPNFIMQNLYNARKDPIIGEPSDNGQFGLALRKYVDQIDTEFGLYYERLHNRTPVLNLNYSLEATVTGSILAGQSVPVYYQVEYPEDMDVYGLSFATNIGVVAWSGEISYKKDMPVGINGTTLLTAGLGVLGSQGALCGTPFSALFYGQFGDRACAAFFDFAFNPTERDHVAQGWDRFDVTQLQSTALYFWDQGLGSQRVTLIGEVAWIYVNDLPSILEMPYGRNPIFGAPTNILDSSTFQPVGFSDEGFVTTNSWGYRIRAAADYPNAFAGVTLTPTLAWAQDVKGTSPTPTFSEGNKALSLGLKFSYLSKYRAGISYTMFTGGVANPTEDRDFFSITFALDF